MGGASQAAAHRAGSTVNMVGGESRLLSLGAEGDEVGHCDGAVMAQASLDFCAFAQRATGSAAPATAAREMIVGQAANERRSRAPRCRHARSDVPTMLHVVAAKIKN